MSQLRANPEHLFDCFCEVFVPPDGDPEPRIVQKHPETFQDQHILDVVPKFALTCATDSSSPARPTVEHFSFVVLKDGKWLFGYCRFSPEDNTALMLLTPLPWHNVFYKLLDTLRLVMCDYGVLSMHNQLAALHEAAVPRNGGRLQFPLPDGTEFVAECPDSDSLPALLDDHNLTEFWSVVNIDAMLELFAALLCERHVLVTSSRVTRLSACVQAAAALLRPLWWQRLFFPVVPAPLRGCLASPVAFLAGAPAAVVAALEPGLLPDGCVLLDADSGTLRASHGDLQRMPADVVSPLQRHLKQAEPGTGVSRAFQEAVLQLVGGFRHGIRRTESGTAVFDKEAFLKSQPSSWRQFLATLVKTQMFEQYVEDRLQTTPPPDSPPPAPAQKPSPLSAAIGALPKLKHLSTLRGRQRAASSGGEMPERRSTRHKRQKRPSVALPEEPLEEGGGGTQSVPSSPAAGRLAGRGTSAPALLLLTASPRRPGAPAAATANGSLGSDTVAPSAGDGLQNGLAEDADDGLDVFPLSSMGGSLMDEINAELMRMRTASERGGEDGLLPEDGRSSEDGPALFESTAVYGVVPGEENGDSVHI